MAKNSTGSTTISQPPISEKEIYGGGNYHRIEIEDLVNNKIAIMQVCNELLQKNTEYSTARETISDLKSQIEYHKTAPFMSIVSMIMTVLGTSVFSLGINCLTSNPSPKYSWFLIIVGILLVILGSVANILFPFARNWFNKTETKKVDEKL